MPIPINDLSREPDELARAMEQAFRAVRDSAWYVLGPHTQQFEARFSAYCGVTDTVGVASGTDALELALRAAGIQHGDAVITAANAGCYGTYAILAVGAEPRYVDVDSQSLLITPDTLGQVDWTGVKALIVTHLYGTMAPMRDIAALAQRRGVVLIEDCAQAHGACRDGKRAGSWGDFGCFSFYPTKNLGALGDGGAVVTSHAHAAQHLRQLRQYGWSSKYCSTVPHGRNSRLDELQAAFLLARLEWLDQANAQRRAIAERYRSEITNPAIQHPPLDGDAFVAHLYVIRTDQREHLRSHLADADIGSEVHYPLPDHRQPFLAGRYTDTRLPTTERACERVLTLPCFPGMTEAEVASVIAAVNRWSCRTCSR